MTKRRPSNKKPSGSNRSLGNCLTNEREKARREHRRKENRYGAENMSEMNKNVAQKLDSITNETDLEELFSKAELDGASFAAKRGEFLLLDSKNSKTDVNIIRPVLLDELSKKSQTNNLRSNFLEELITKSANTSDTIEELQRKYGDRLRIPRRPPKHLWETADELKRLEEENFREWRKNLTSLEMGNGVTLFPFERNLEFWRQLWRVVERSDIVVQILDARNPLLFRNLDLEAYVKECDIAKQHIYLINKADLLTNEQIDLWRKWFLETNVDAVFWCACDPETKTEDEKEEKCEHNFSSSSSSEIDSCDEKSDLSSSSSSNMNIAQSIDFTQEKIPVIYSALDLIAFFKSRGHTNQSCDQGRKSVVVGMVGYPNVGKSSTINKILNQKRVPVSATPGKTRHFQTLVVDDELTLCDCPGLVMPAFALNRSEMILNGMLSIDHLHEYSTPITLLLTRVPRRCFEKIYSIMLTDDDDTPFTATDLLTIVAFSRGFMTSNGVTDHSRAARLILKDVVTGKLKWVAAPPGENQEKFDKLTYGIPDEVTALKTKSNIVQQLEKLHLLQDRKALGQELDRTFFLGLNNNMAHIRPINSALQNNGGKPSKKHYNRGKREKLRRIYRD